MNRTIAQVNAEAVLAFDDLVLREVIADFSCDFNQATNASACDGPFDLRNTQGQQAGVFPIIAIGSSFKLTDKTTSGKIGINV